MRDDDDDRSDGGAAAFDDPKKFRRYRILGGQIVVADVGKRNGRDTLLLRLGEIEVQESGRPKYSAEFIGLLRDVYRNLTPLQRRTWHKILLGKSILDIAAEEGVERGHIYQRIYSMIKRNKYCERWWRRRDKKNQYQ